MLPLLGIYTKKSLCYYRDTCKSMFIAALFKFAVVSVSSSVVSGRYYILEVFYNATMYNVQKLYKFKSEKSSTEKGNWTQSSTPRQEAICNVHLLRKRKLIFSYEVSQGVSNIHKTELMLRNSWRAENG